MNQLLPAQSPYQKSPTLRLDVYNNWHKCSDNGIAIIKFGSQMHISKILILWKKNKNKFFQHFQYFDYIIVLFFFSYQGHSRSGEVQNHHHRVLQRCYGKGQTAKKMCTLRITFKLSNNWQLIGLVRANLVFSEQYTCADLEEGSGGLAPPSKI